MGVMDAEKQFDEEMHYMFKQRIETVLNNVNQRFHGYYADDKKEAVEIIKKLLFKFNAELSGGG